MAENTMLQHNCAPIGCSICKITQLEVKVEELEDRMEQIRACLIELEHLTRKDPG